MLKGKTPLVVALVLGLLAGSAAYTAVSHAEAAVRRGYAPKPVLVAAVDISEGAVLAIDMVATRLIPEQFVTSSVVNPDSASYVIGQKLLVPVQAGDPLLWSQLETARATERLSTRIQKQARAMTIAVKGVNAVGSWVKPNDHVDIIGTFKNPDDNQQTAITLMQNMLVVATGRITGTTNVNLLPESQREYSNVTLMLLPEEAEVLALAQELGSLTLTLRNEDDLDMMDRRAKSTVATLFSGERLVAMEAKRRGVIEFIRNSSSERVRTGP